MSLNSNGFGSTFPKILSKHYLDTSDISFTRAGWMWSQSSLQLWPLTCNLISLSKWIEVANMEPPSGNSFKILHLQDKKTQNIMPRGSICHITGELKVLICVCLGLYPGQNYCNSLPYWFFDFASYWIVEPN